MRITIRTGGRADVIRGKALRLFPDATLCLGEEDTDAYAVVSDRLLVHPSNVVGIGPRTAETLMAYIDDPRRFARAGQMAAYFGLVPCQDASAGIDRLGHITKQGPRTARKYLVEATWQGVRRSPTIRAHYERILGGRPERRKIALVATAHCLLRCMFAMLHTGEGWREGA